MERVSVSAWHMWRRAADITAVFNADLRSPALNIAHGLPRSRRLYDVDWQFVSRPPGGNSMYYDNRGGPGDMLASVRPIKTGLSLRPASCGRK